MSIAHKLLTCAVIITSHNRLQELQRTCAVLKTLDPQPGEYLFTADGCNDGTVKWLRKEFPRARIFVNNPGKGSAASRDHMLRQANADIVLSLDDDSYPLEKDAITRLQNLFLEKNRLGVASLPQRTDEYPATHGQEDFGSIHSVGSFSSCAVCIRRDAYLSTQGYPSFFYHAYEEPDFALQAIATGWDVLWYPDVIIRHHYSSTGRNEQRIHALHARNEFWSVLMRCPFPQMPLVAIYKVFSQFRYAWSRGADWVVREPGWWCKAIVGIPQATQQRQPVSWSNYLRWLKLLSR